MATKTHPDFIPPWQDMPTLCRHICVSPNTVDTWVKEGLLPPPRRIKGKQMWRWLEVEAYLLRGGSLDPDAERIRHDTRKAEANAHR